MPAFTKRMLITAPAGALLGLFCAYMSGFFSVSDPIFWITFLDRLLIGVVVGMAGFVTRHPFFFFPCYALRGAFFGAFISLLMALAVLVAPQEENAIQLFWFIMIVGTTFGLILDIVATKIAGQGKDLLQK